MLKTKRERLMNLEFPWELNVKQILKDNFRNDIDNSEIVFIENGKKKRGKNIYNVKNSKIEIIKLIVTTDEHNRGSNELPFMIEAYETGPIPNIKNLTNVASLFMSSEFETIPEDLFKYNPELRHLDRCFLHCDKLKKIPEELFKYNTMLATLQSTFLNCTSLESLPKRLFKDNQSYPSLNYCFSNCISITEIPEGFLKYVDNNYLGRTFANCINLETINGDIFSPYMSLTPAYFNKIFSNCPKLRNIPSELLMSII